MPAGSLSSIGTIGGGAGSSANNLVTHPTPKRKGGRTKVSNGNAPTNAATDLYIPWPVTGPGSAPEWEYTPGNGRSVAKGYDAAGANPGTARKSAAMNKNSGYLVTGGSGGPQMSLFITSVNMDTQLSGSTAQSKFIQDFYPHNFVQPAITVSGWSLDQQDYGTLCEFVHHCQRQALNASQGWAPAMTQLVVLGKSQLASGKKFSGTIRALPDGTDGANTKYGPFSTARAVTVTYGKGASAYNQSIKGDHDTIIAKGYISSMPRIHQQFEYAVQWEFDFVIAAMVHGLYHDNRASVSLPGSSGDGTWMNLLADAQAVGLSTVSAAQNAASLVYASQHSAVYLGESPAGGSANANGGSASTGNGTYQISGSVSGWSSQQNDWAKQMLSAGLTLGWNKIGACGIIGNAFQESFGAPGIGPNTNIPGCKGLVCWSAADGNADASKVVLGNIPSQMQLIITGSTGIGQSGVTTMNGYPTAGGAAQWFEENFEHAGAPDMQNRIDAANSAYAAFTVTQTSNDNSGASTNGSPTSSMVTLYNYAKNNNSGTSGGHCLAYVQDYLQATGAPGHQVPRLPYAWDFATTVGSNGYGLKKLSSTNPYDAPQGCIVVVPHPAPGTSMSVPGSPQPGRAGDISIASGSGSFINDGPNEQYGGSAGAWDSAGFHAALFVPTDF